MSWDIVINSNDCDWLFIDMPGNMKSGRVERICSHPESESRFCAEETCPKKVDNSRKYRKHEFCKAMNCSWFQHGTCTLKPGCSYSAWENDEVDVDFYEAVLMVVDDTAKAVQQSKNKRLKSCWTRLRNSVTTLYSHMTEDVPAQARFDPDWIGFKYMKLGKALGQRLEEVIAS